MTSLRTAIGTRHALGVAQGLLMTRSDLDEHQSFELLKRLSSTHEIRICDLAESVVNLRGIPQELTSRTPWPMI